MLTCFQVLAKKKKKKKVIRAALYSDWWGCYNIFLIFYLITCLKVTAMPVLLLPCASIFHTAILKWPLPSGQLILSQCTRHSKLVTQQQHNEFGVLKRPEQSPDLNSTENSTFEMHLNGRIS